jgi:hypothetical protein
MAKLTFIIILAIAGVILGPIATIWSLNTLFPTLAIPYTLSTWAASLILFGSVVKGNFSLK